MAFKKAYKYVRKGYRKNWKTLRGYTDPVSKGVYGFGKRSIVNSLPFIKESLGLNTEIKYKEFERNDIVIGRDGGTDIDFEEVSDVAIGDNKDQMHGNSFRCQSLQLRGFVFGDPVVPTMFRMMIFKWNDDTEPTIQDILEDYPTSSVSTDDINRFYLKGSNDYKILYDRTMLLMPQADGNPSQRQLKILLPLKNKVKRRTSGGSNVFVTGRIYVVCMSNQTSTQRPVVTYRTRLNFVDN